MPKPQQKKENTKHSGKITTYIMVVETKNARAQIVKNKNKLLPHKT